ncbi:hypothetical protein BGZ98_003330 [Dissophora globulifera]|nr:hypothetical protein BGZ98_003330 [Dissophora globulifera]
MGSLKNSMKLNSPLPKDLAGECKKASKILNAFIDPIAAQGLDNVIPPDILSNAKGLAIFTVIKAGFLFSGRAGSGLVVARLDDGSWSAPSAIGTGGVGFGGQVGAEITDFVIVLNNRAAVKSFSSGGNVTLGGNLSVAAGPIGRNAEAGASASMKSVAAIYSYSVSIEGSVIMERKDANQAFYRRQVSAGDLLNGEIAPPPQADVLYRALNSRASGGYGYSRNDLLGDDMYSTPGINRSGSSYSGGRYGSNQDSNAENRDNSSGRGRYGTYSNYSDNNSNAQSTDAKPGKYGALRSDEQEDPVPSYSPRMATPLVSEKGGYSRPSTDNNNPFQVSHENQTITNSQSSSGSKVPPAIGAKPDIVTALYDFKGEQATDLSFKKGDIITVVKKTPSRNDWWTGRCNGRLGSFPANYTE